MTRPPRNIVFPTDGRGVNKDTAYYERLRAHFMTGPGLARILDHSQVIIVAVDADRRMVYGTKNALALAGVTDMDALLGRAPGDFFRCVNAEAAGCGNGPNCSECGTLLGIRAGLAGLESEGACHLTSHAGNHLEARDFRVRGLPFVFESQPYAILLFEDVGHEQRRRALERIFLHDILNSVGAIKGILQFLRDDLTGTQQELVTTVLPHFDICVDEIAAQRKLLAAETGELVLSCDRFVLSRLLQGLVHIYAQHAVAAGKTIALDARCGEAEMFGDRVVVHRICLNLLKNALEATPAGQTVRLEADQDGDGFRVTVRNPGRMPDAVQRQLFHRSFSTKGLGRGLGTYSVHLLCANYLGGRVWFESTDAEGTAFHVFIPNGCQAVERQPRTAGTCSSTDV